METIMTLLLSIVPEMKEFFSITFSLLSQCSYNTAIGILVGVFFAWLLFFSMFICFVRIIKYGQDTRQNVFFSEGLFVGSVMALVFAIIMTAVFCGNYLPVLINPDAATADDLLRKFIWMTR